MDFDDLHIFIKRGDVESLDSELVTLDIIRVVGCLHELQVCNGTRCFITVKVEFNL